MIIGTIGKLGRGKTLSGVMWLYEGYCEGETCYTNLPVSFPHVPVKTAYDFLQLRKGRFLADELWALIDNRRAMSALNILMTIILLRSRKLEFNVFYTQQFLQVDPRMAFVTDKWIRPKVFPYDPEGKIKYKPEILIQECWDGDFNPRPTIKYENVGIYCSLYDTHQDPYTIEAMVSERAIKKALGLVYKSDPDIKQELVTVTKAAKTSQKVKKMELINA